MQTKSISQAHLAHLLRRISFNRHLGIRLVRMHPDGVTIACPVRSELLNAAGVLHGGVTAAMADVAVGMSVARVLGRTRAATTVELKVNFLRPVSGRKILARSHLLRVGSTLATGRVDLFDEQATLVGVALVTYMLLGPPPTAVTRAAIPGKSRRGSRGKSR